MAAYVKNGDKISKLYAKHFLCKGNIISDMTVAFKTFNFSIYVHLH